MREGRSCGHGVVRSWYSPAARAADRLLPLRPPVDADLRLACDARSEVVHELRGKRERPLSREVRRDELGLRVDREDGVGVAEVRRMSLPLALLVHADVRPD